jgi:hypothetical protein
MATVSIKTGATALLSGAKMVLLGLPDDPNAAGESIGANQTELVGAMTAGAITGALVQGLRHNKQVESGEMRPYKAGLI